MARALRRLFIVRHTPYIPAVIAREEERSARDTERRTIWRNGQHVFQEVSLLSLSPNVM